MTKPKLPYTSERALELFRDFLTSQNAKGLAKYNVSIDDAKDEDYNWLAMGLEEAADLMQYLTREIMRLEKEKRDTSKALLIMQMKLVESAPDDDYNKGLYNGMELALAMIEKRKPELKKELKQS